MGLRSLGIVSVSGKHHGLTLVRVPQKINEPMYVTP